MPADGTQPQPFYLPHIDQLLKSLRVSRERLSSRSKIAVDTRLLRVLLQTLAARLPFDSDFYLQANPDIAEAFKAGQIPDLHRHFVENGYLEGRAGAKPPVDEAFYAKAYPDIGLAISRGEISSAADHYATSGAAEGRVPSEAMRAEVERWAGVLSDDAAARASGAA
jgi:hypothetical protein